MNLFSTRDRNRTAGHRRTAVVAAAVSGALAGTLLLAPTANAADAHTDLTDQYTSLSGALLNFYAEQSGASLADYLTAQQVLLAPTTVGDPVAERLSPTGEPTTEPATGPSAGTDGYGEFTDTPNDPGSTGTQDGAGPAGPVPAGRGGVLSADQARDLGVTGKPVSAATLGDLNKQLSAAGLTVDTKGYTSLDALADKVAATSATPDGAVTLAGAKWAAQLGSLHVPALATPKASGVNAPGIPKDALPYGLLLNKSLTAMVTDHPDLFADAKKSGLGSAALDAAWSRSMLKAYESSKADFSKVLPDPCTGGMLAVMASGNPASAAKTGGSCSTSTGCLAGGMYLHNQAKGLFDPNRKSVVANPAEQVWNETTYGRFRGWSKGLAMAQNPGLTAGSLTAKLTGTGTSGACSAASAATTNSLKQTLPGVFNTLR